MNRYPGKKIFISGDFNARIGLENSYVDREIFDNSILLNLRESLDNTFNSRGRILIDCME